MVEKQQKKIAELLLMGDETSSKLRDQVHRPAANNSVMVIFE